MPYDNERKAPTVNVDDAKKIMEMVRHQETQTVKLSDNRIIGFYRYNGKREPNITVENSFQISMIPPQQLEDLVFRFLEIGEQFVIKAGENSWICGESSYRIILANEPA